MTNKNVTVNKELVNKLSNIIKQYDPYTAYIDDYKQYSNAVDINSELDQQFIHTCNEYGYHVGVSSCYSLAKSLASGKFDSAEETVIDYINSLTKEDDSILSSPNTIPENIDNANKEEIAMKKNININNATTEVKEESTMTNEMIKDEVKVVSTTLTQENGELTFVELSPEQKIQISAVLDAQLQDVNYSSWFEEENGVFKLYGSWVDEDSAVKEEYYFNGNKLIKIEKEESIMKDDNTTVSINSETTVEEKEETTMSKTKIRRDSHESFESWINRINDLLSSNGIHLDNDKLLTIIDDETDCVSIESEDINVHGWCAGEPFYCCYDFHGNLKEYSDEGTNFESVEVEKEETIMKTRTTQELINDALNITKIQDENYVTNAMLRKEYKKLTGNVIGSKKTRPVIIKAIQDELHKEPAKIAPDDAKVLTYKLMHKIGDHALSNRKKGFGTTISAKILCAFIVEVASLNDPEPIDRLYVPTGKKDKYGKDITMINPKITEEHKNKCKDVRNWLLNHRYIKPVTFKDEKGFTFYTPEYDGNRKDKMYDCTKFQATGKVETTTYKVTKEMNKWYV